MMETGNTRWRTRITTLIELYDKHQVLSALGQGRGIISGNRDRNVPIIVMITTDALYTNEPFVIFVNELGKYLVSRVTVRFLT